MKIRFLFVRLLWGMSLQLTCLSLSQAQIHVTMARIGCLDIQKDGNLTDIVGRACNGKYSCSFKAPTEQEYKREGVHAATRFMCTQAMEIQYQCSSGPTQSVTVPGDAWNQPPANLECQPPLAAGASPPPGSCVATFMGKPLPEGKKWFPVQIATSHRNPICPDRNVQIVELRGWLRSPSPTCNGEDPDWHYSLEVDIPWAVSQGIDISRLFRVGDIYWNAYKASNTGAREKAVSTPMIELELWGWRPGDHPQQAAPPGWGFTNADSANCQGVYWPYNPLNPKPGQAAAEGKYVRVVGSLVTDEPHEHQAGFPTFACGNFGAFCSDTAKDNDIKIDWGNGINDQASDPARWTEFHPPDLIETLADPGHKETLRGIAVLSEHCLAGHCAAQTVDEDVAPPAPCPSGTRLSYQELVGTAPNETNLATVEDGNAGPHGSNTGAQITVGASSIHVHVMVRGRSANGAYGRFKALYRVSCGPLTSPPAPPPNVSVRATALTMVQASQRGPAKLRMQVTITDPETKKPVPQAAITLFEGGTNSFPLGGPNQPIYANTGNDGIATFEYNSCWLPTFEHVVPCNAIVTKAGYLQTSFGTPALGVTKSWSIGAGAHVNVKDANTKAPVQGAEVDIFDSRFSSPGRVLASGTTGTDGTVVFSPPSLCSTGFCTIAVRKQGYPDFSTSLQ